MELISVKKTVRLVPMVFVDSLNDPHPRTVKENLMVPVYSESSPKAVAIEILDDANDPLSPKGAIWVVDPLLKPTPGRWVVASYGHGPTRETVLGRLRYEASAQGTVTIIDRANPLWPAARSDIKPLHILAVRIEMTLRG